MDRDKFAGRRAFMDQALRSGAWTLAAASGLLTPLMAAAKKARVLPPGRSIYDMRGEVLVDGEPATMETLITATSVIVTGSDSFIEFKVGKDAHHVRENSRLELSGSGMVEDAMRVVAGKVLAVFGRRKRKESYTIQTTTAVIGIRGTGIYIEADPDVSYICTCYGTVDLVARADENVKERLKTKHHDAPKYVYSDTYGGKLIEPAPFKDHTDQELMLLEEIVGRTPPFSSLLDPYSTPRRDGYRM
ncbi:MAG: FecR domain-containing protein [Gammaproteobacteria bacterium]|nr:FecR domain-containing protein [Gammaproteobacteria bacterium]NNF59845.1 hypothetical protein [Gammaproteobacteria bacterium]NNM21281.1 hypothetical protein [Gammaproteobacteria bacterium]